MFEVGKEYKVHLIENEVEDSFDGEVIEIDGPIIKFIGDVFPEKIVNTSAPNFVRADLLPYRSPEEIAAERARWKI